MRHRGGQCSNCGVDGGTIILVGEENDVSAEADAETDPVEIEATESTPAPPAGLLAADIGP